jgi:hypothetical protein
MPSCLQPKVQYISTSGSATLAGFLGTNDSDSDSGPAQQKRYRTKTQTSRSEDDSNSDTEANFFFQKKSTYNESFEASMNAQPGTGDFRGCPHTKGLLVTYTATGSSSSVSRDYVQEEEGGPWTLKVVGTSLTTVEYIGGKPRLNTSDSDDTWPDDWCEYTTTAKDLRTGTVAVTKTVFRMFAGGEGDVAYSDEIEIPAALAEAEAWLDAQAATMLAGDPEEAPEVASSESSDAPPECGIGSDYIASTSVRAETASLSSIQLVSKSYFKYRFKLHRCSGEYAGLSWLEIFYSTKLSDWLATNNASGTRPTGPATTSKSWAHAGTNTDPRCRGGNGQPYADAEIYADQTRWSPWSLLVSSPSSAGSGSKYLTAMHISCYRSIYGTVPTKVNGYGDYDAST